MELSHEHTFICEGYFISNKLQADQISFSPILCEQALDTQVYQMV